MPSPSSQFVIPSYSPRSLYRQRELLSLHHLGVIDPEEITIQHRLYESSQHRSLVQVSLGHISPYPVRDVQRAVRAQRRDVVDRDCVRLAGALQHEQLRQDGDGLEPDAEGPQDLDRLVFEGEEERHDGCAHEQVLNTEGVEGRRLRRPVGRRHQVDGVGRGGQEEELEDGVVVVGVEGFKDVWQMAVSWRKQIGFRGK